jgi:hypothetical protein
MVKAPDAHENRGEIAVFSRLRSLPGAARERSPHPGVNARVWTAVEPFATGEVYVNRLDAEEGTRIRAAYSDNFGQLVALKNKYDPTNLFRLNQNIKPTS